MSTNTNVPSINELNKIQKSIDSLISSNKSLELDLEPNGTIIQNLLSKRLNKEKISVPQIFINSQHIGGCDDLLAKEQKGELDQLL
ncbi:hypothetical protein KEM48_007774 [Puccinia striiformis f. sp. tritici PST-130]|nr:hypothetical protein KEM48_007774 [Puccinia striiformis f. sp. tritici PST-130]